MKHVFALVLTLFVATLLLTIKPEMNLFAAIQHSEATGSIVAAAVDDHLQANLRSTDPLPPQSQSSSEGSWLQSNVDGFGDAAVPSILVLQTYKGHLYAGNDSRAGGNNRLMRSTDGMKWVEVVGNQFGNQFNYAIADLVEFKGKLYAGTWHWDWNQSVSYGGEVWRSEDGTSWTPVATGGFGTSANEGISRMIVFKDQLYAFTASYIPGAQMQLWRTTSGNSGEWTQVTGGPFTNPEHAEATTLQIFQDRLYLGTYNEIGGGELWYSEDGAVWTKATIVGLGGVKTSAIASLEPLGSLLCFSTRNLPDGGEIWCSPNGIDWARVAAGGFGDVNNGRLYNLTNWNGKLYVMAGNAVKGLSVWRSEDGISWHKLSDGGWGDGNNILSNYDDAVLPFNDYLYFGASNSETGTELWRYSTDSAQETFLPFLMQ